MKMTPTSGARSSTVDRALAILRLFTTERSEWTVEAAAKQLGLSQSTAYEYFGSLVRADLLSTYRPGRYIVGPGVVELDRQTRRWDPLILAARDPMNDLATGLEGDDVVLLCRLYRLTVMCVDQRTRTGGSANISYERGRPMPLARGAASKAILAHLPPRTLRRAYDQIQDSELDPSWEDFRKSLRGMRKAGFSVARGEIDPGRVGISAPVFSDGEVIGSIGLVLSQARLDTAFEQQFGERVVVAGKAVTASLQKPDGSAPAV